MNLNSFLTCLNVNGIVSGNSIQGVYTFSSGDSNLIYNNLYPTGNMYYSGLVSTISYPLINVGQPISNSYFSGTQLFRIGYTSSGDFGLLLDIQYDSCSKQNLVDYCLLSSNTLNNSGKNFTLTINDANRLTLKTSGGYYSTVSQELTEHDLVYFSMAQHQYLTFGVFNVANNYFYSNQINLGGPILNSDIVYIGGEFNNFTSTGFFGTINNAVLFCQAPSNLNICVNCYLTTGYIINSNTQTVNVPQITGFFYSGIQTSYQTTGIASGIISKVNGGTINLEFGTASTSGITSGLLVSALYGTTGLNISQPSYQFFQDTGIVNTYNKFELAFGTSLQSGDALEIYTYYYPIPNIGTQLIGFEVPANSGIMQLIVNGVDETLNVDYTIVRNQVSGFYSNDVLAFDSLNSQSVIVNFSGVFNNIFTGSSGVNSILNVTGLSGVCYSNTYYPSFGYDIFLNGQKLISGYEYGIQTTGVSGFSVNISGVEILNPTNNGIDNAELGFIPQFNNIIYFLSGVTQTTQTVTGIAGFSEQVWVNGVRQIRNIDYFIYNPCSTVSGLNNINLPFKFYNNDQVAWNFNYPPIILNYSGYLQTGNGNLSGFYSWSNINSGIFISGIYPSGSFIEIWANYNSGLFNLINNIDVLSTGFSYNIGVPIHGVYGIQTRYHSGNLIGDFSSGYYISY
jgi:hypothetical protein